jgi:hypothetical protein
MKGVKPLLELAGFVFQLFTSRRSWKLQAFTDVERNKWVVTLSNAINGRDLERARGLDEFKSLHGMRSPAHESPCGLVGSVLLLQVVYSRTAARCVMHACM